MTLTNRRVTAVVLLLALASAAPVFAHLGLHERIRRLDREIKASPADARLYVRRGELFRDHGEWQAARADYERARTIAPSLIDIDYYEGCLLLDEGKPDEARPLLERFLEQRPGHVGALVQRARVLARLGRHADAAVGYSRAIEVLHDRRKSNPDLYLARAREWMAAGRVHFDQALHGLDDGLAVLGPVVSLELLAIDIEVEREHYDAALTRLAASAARSKRQETWLFRRGKILEKAGRQAAADSAYSRALRTIERLSRHRRSTRSVAKLENSLKRAQSALKRAPRAGAAVPAAGRSDDGRSPLQSTDP